MAKATTVRFTDDMFARLDQASARTGMPINSIVIAACLEWMSRHVERQVSVPGGWAPEAIIPPAPRWATLRRAVVQAVSKHSSSTLYPFERFTAGGKKLLTLAQTEALKAGHSYVGTEHLLLAAFQDPGLDSARILANLGVDEAAARRSIEQVLGQGRLGSRTRMVPTARVKRVLELAFALCSEAGDPRVSTGHILLSLSVEGDGIAARVLNDLGATKDRIETARHELTEPEA